jgi:hypothetical protein
MTRWGSGVSVVCRGSSSKNAGRTSPKLTIDAKAKGKIRREKSKAEERRIVSGVAKILKSRETPFTATKPTPVASEKVARQTITLRATNIFISAGASCASSL